MHRRKLEQLLQDMESDPALVDFAERLRAILHMHPTCAHSATYRTGAIGQTVKKCLDCGEVLDGSVWVALPAAQTQQPQEK